MSNTNVNNFSILPCYTAEQYQHHRKKYTYGAVFPLIAELYKMPCFQIRRDTLVGDITSVIIRNVGTGDETEAVGALQLTGLEVQAFADYDLVVYPGNDAMTDIVFTEGMYEAVITDGTNTWYTERWQWRTDVSRFIKISFWHDVPFALPGYHISYRDPFRSFLYLNSVINKPEYIEEEQAEDRDGYKFAIYQISKKRYKIVGLLLPEYMCDALRTLWQHHYVSIVYEGITYNPDDIRVIFGDWQDQGHLCAVSIEFHTDTVVTQTGYIKNESDGGDYDQTDYNDDHLIA